MLDSCKMLQKQSEAFHTLLLHFFQVLNRMLLHIILLKCPHVQNALLKFTSCCSCSFKAEIIKIGQSSHKMYSNNIVNFQESSTILNACTKKSGNLLNAPYIYICIYIYIYIYIYICVCVCVCVCVLVGWLDFMAYQPL